MPKLFYTNASAKAEVAQLEGQIATLETNAVADASTIERLTAEIATANESLSAMTTERDEAAASITELEGKLETSTAELTTAQEAVAGFDDKVEAAALAKFQGLGGDPIAGSKKDDTQTKSDISEKTGLDKVTAAFAKKSK